MHKIKIHKITCPGVVTALAVRRRANSFSPVIGTPNSTMARIKSAIIGSTLPANSQNCLKNIITLRYIF